MRRFAMLAALTAAVILLGTPGALATHSIPDAEVTEGSADAVPLQNKQNEPIVAINPRVGETNQVAAGANDNIDLEGCLNRSDNTCPFTAGVGVTGFAGSLDGGLTWNQPDYTGWSARACLGLPGESAAPADNCDPAVGPIGTVPWYFEEGLVADGDPVQTWGPRPGADGTFSWSNGSRLYYQDLVSNFSARRDEQTFRGFEAIGVSWSDNFPAAVVGDKNAWSRPVLISGSLSAVTFSDKNWIAADDAASSPFFGYVHACWVSFRSIGGAPEPVMYARSTDGGVTWDQRKQLTPAANTGRGHGRQGCQVDTDSDGVVYVFFRGGEIGRPQDPPTQDRAMLMTRSFDGGVRWERARPVAEVEECGLLDPVQGRRTFDGVAGARTNSFPSVSIANGAPLGNGPNTIVLSWCDGPTTTTGAAEEALVQWSSDKGETWSAPVDAAPAADRPDFPAVAISPDGTDVYMTYMNFLQPWQATTAGPRLMHGVVRHASFAASLGAFADVHRGANGDARASTANSLAFEFLGDYNAVDAENDFAVAVWNDVRAAGDCPAIDAWRQAQVDFRRGTGPDPGPPPPITSCPPTFGNSDIWGTRVNDPSP
jgi:hypothetical protein